MSFKERLLGDLLTFQRGFDITKAEQSVGVVPIVSSSGISSFHNEAKVHGPGVVIGRKGTLGTVHYIDRDYWPHDTTLWVKDFKGSHPRFLSYFLSTLKLENFDTGASNPTLNRNHLHKIKVLVPDPAEQEKIAAILATFDDLIANNLRRIALLESISEEIYREWFVRMRFPQHAHLKCDALEPADWTRQPIGKLADLIKRGISPDYDDRSERLVINQKCIRGGRLSMVEARLHSTVVPDEKILRNGDILINSTGVGTLGRSAVFDLDVEGVTCDSHVTILRPRDGIAIEEFLAYTIQLLQTYFESMASGSTGQAELSRELISRTKVLVPTQSLLEAFSTKVRPIRRQRRSLLEQKEKLVLIRDQLLPRLISGKLRVDQLDIQYPPSIMAVQEQSI